MSCCSAQCCSGCCDEIREESRIRKVEICSVAACTAGDLPDLLRDEDDDDDDGEPEFKEGDHMFATGLKGPTEEVRATSTISQRLAEAFKRNSELDRSSMGPNASAEGIPDRFREFHSVFSKESFDVLPDHKPWDHAIELVPGETPAGCKVTPFPLPSRRSWTPSSKRT